MGSEHMRQKVCLLDLGKIVTGKTPPTSSPGVFGGGIPFVTPRDLDGRKTILSTERTLTEAGRACVGRSALPELAVMVSCIGSDMGKVALAGRPCVTNQQINSIVVAPPNVPEYVYYDLSTRKTELMGLASGSAQPILNKGHFGQVVIVMPPPAEQRRIAHILGTLDDKIELNRRMNETLEAMAQALFKNWFVDFDPVIDKALAAGNPIPDAFADRAAQRAAVRDQYPPLPDHLLALFPDRFQDSSLGPIPEGWGVLPLDEIADFLNGAACQKFPAEPGRPSLPVIKIREMTQGVTENTDRASTAVPDKYRVEDGDVLFSWSGSLLVMVWCGGTGFLNQHVFKVTSERYPKWFFLGWLRRHLAEFQQVAADKATTMGHIKRHHLSDAQTLVPPARLLETATAAMAPLLEEQVANSRQGRILERTRDALLPCLLAGKTLGVEMAGQHLPAQETGGTL